MHNVWLLVWNMCKLMYYSWILRLEIRWVDDKLPPSTITHSSGVSFFEEMILISGYFASSKPPNSDLISGHPDCSMPPQQPWVLEHHTLSLSLSCSLLFPRWQDPRAPLFSILAGGRRALCLAAIVPDACFYLTDTRAVKREREWRRRGNLWPLFSRGWWWKDETRWPSVVRVCNL